MIVRLYVFICIFTLHTFKLVVLVAYLLKISVYSVKLLAALTKSTRHFSKYLLDPHKKALTVFHYKFEINYL